MAFRVPAVFWCRRSGFQNTTAIRTHLKSTQVLCLQRALHLQLRCTVSSKISRPRAESSQELFYSTDPTSSTHQYGLIKRGWIKFSQNVKAFMNGTKSVYYDMKRVYQLEVKEGPLKISPTAPTENFPFSREQLQFIYKNKKDVKKMAPVVVLFFVPVLGYAALLAFVFPQWMLSSHFLTAEQKQQFSRARFDARMQQFRSLAYDTKQCASREQLHLFEKLKEQLLEGSSQDLRELQRVVQNNPDLPFTLRELPWKHLSLLSSGWGLLSWLPLGYQRRRLKRHLAYVFCSDWLISLEGGVGRLTQQEVVLGCMERGLNIELGVEGMRIQLQQWVNISTQFKECPMSLLAHLPLAQFHQHHHD